MELHAKKRVGVLALQGAFQEHSAVLQQLGAQTREVRTTADLDGLDGIVLPGAFGFCDRTNSRAGLNTRVCSPHPDPGGESTAMAIVEGGDGLFAALKQWVSDDKPASRFPCWLCSPVRSRATHTPCPGLGHVRGHDPAGGRCGRSKGVEARLPAALSAISPPRIPHPSARRTSARRWPPRPGLQELLRLSGVRDLAARRARITSPPPTGLEFRGADPSARRGANPQRYRGRGGRCDSVAPQGRVHPSTGNHDGIRRRRGPREGLRGPVARCTRGDRMY